MKKLKDLILERLHINKNTKVIKNKVKDPEIYEIAWDYNSEPWEIYDFCELTNQSELTNIIKKYDDSGCFKDFLDEFDQSDYPEVKYAVGAVNENGDCAVFIWGYEGLCFENKPKK